MVKTRLLSVGVDTWNKLHSDIKLAPSIQLFKAKLKAHNRKYSRKAGFNILFFLFNFLSIGMLYIYRFRPLL